MCRNTHKDDSRELVALAVQAVLPVLLPIAVPALGPEPAKLNLPALLILLGLLGLRATLPGAVKLWWTA